MKKSKQTNWRYFRIELRLIGLSGDGRGRMAIRNHSWDEWDDWQEVLTDRSLYDFTTIIANYITGNTTNRFVTDAEKATWNAKANNTVATTSANGLMSSTDKTKLDSVAAGATNYTHPANHPASVITQDANSRFVTDAEKATWNAKANNTVATTGANGLMSSTDKTKLDRATGVRVFYQLSQPINPQFGDIWIIP